MEVAQEFSGPARGTDEAWHSFASLFYGEFTCNQSTHCVLLLHP